MPGSVSPRFSLSSARPDAAEPATGFGNGQLPRLAASGRRRRGAERPVGSGPAPPPSAGRRLAEWVVIIGIALLVAFLIKSYVLEAFFIPSGSMEPTLLIGDRILVDKLSYDLHPVHRGDIVVFHNPLKNDGTIKDLVKRVVGLPGETIASAPDWATSGHILINGEVIAQPWLRKGIEPGPEITPQTIRKGCIFVMGDNRPASEDSRAFGSVPGCAYGQIPESSIVGRVIVRVWPLGRFHFF